MKIRLVIMFLMSLIICGSSYDSEADEVINNIIKEQDKIKTLEADLQISSFSTFQNKKIILKAKLFQKGEKVRIDFNSPISASVIVISNKVVQISDDGNTEIYNKASFDKNLIINYNGILINGFTENYSWIFIKELYNSFNWEIKSKADNIIKLIGISEDYQGIISEVYLLIDTANWDVSELKYFGDETSSPTIINIDYKDITGYRIAVNTMTQEINPTGKIKISKILTNIKINSSIADDLFNYKIK